MKKVIIILLALALCPLFANAQSKQINDILDKYEKKKTVESIEVTPSLLSFMTNTEDAETNEALSKITKIRILNINTSAIENGVPLRNALRSELDILISKEQFSRVVKVKDGEEMLEVFIAQNGQGALLFLASSTQEFTVISIFGKIDKGVVNSLMNGTIQGTMKRSRPRTR
ncbi:MAG: DUF4252 domain-containing protein [Clostridia bacterium]|nr:DUF4252 domain-containing protein [Clostridia bacterium]